MGRRGGGHQGDREHHPPQQTETGRVSLHFEIKTSSHGQRHFCSALLQLTNKNEKFTVWINVMEMINPKFPCCTVLYCSGIGNPTMFSVSGV